MTKQEKEQTRTVFFDRVTKKDGRKIIKWWALNGPDGFHYTLERNGRFWDVIKYRTVKS